MNKIQCKIRVRYAETDQMGIVYHSNYFVWFEIGRTTLLREIGYSYKELEKCNIMLPVVEVQCNYKEAAKYDDEIIIESRVEEIKGVRITFGYQLYRKSDGQLLATGKTTHAFVDKNLKPVNFKKKSPEIYGKLIEASQ